MDDLEFVQRCVEGDKQSWGQFVDRYSRLIYNYIHSVLRLKTGSDFKNESVSDIFQEIFLSLTKDNFKKLKTYRAKNGAKFATWLRQVTINHTLDHLRKLKPLASLDEEDPEGFSLNDIFADDAVTVRDMLNCEERLAHLKDCIGGLDYDDKYFLQLYLDRRLKLEELRVFLGLSRPAVDMRKSRIVGRLRDCFRAKGFALDF